MYILPRETELWGVPENSNVCNENLEFEEEKLEVPVFTHKNEHIKPAQIGMEPRTTPKSRGISMIQQAS